MGFKATTVASIASYLAARDMAKSFIAVGPSATQLATFQAQFAPSELRALMGSDGSIALLHLAGYPVPFNDANGDIQGNQVVPVGTILQQVGELQPWINTAFSKVGITNAGLYYCNAGVNMYKTGLANSTATAVALAQYLALYGAQMGPPVSSV